MEEDVWVRIALRTIDGREYLSDAMTAEDLEKMNMTEDEAKEEFERLFQQFSDLTYLSIEVEGRKKYFNPANIVWVELVD